MDRQERRSKTRYLVKWKGYIVEENIWEGLENLKNAMEKIEEFEKEDLKRNMENKDKERERNRS